MPTGVYEHKPWSPERKLKMRADILDKSVKWKGEKAGYQSKHQVARKHFLKDKCEHCNVVKNLHMANVSGKYLREASDWKTLCAKCHYKFDKKLHLAKSYPIGISGYRGVKPHKKTNGWYSRITINYKEVSLGYFKDIETAVMIRLSAEAQLIKGDI